MADNVVKGTLYMTLAYLLFAIGGYIVYVGLGRFLLTPEEFGIYSVIVSFIAVINTFLIAGSKQSTAKFVSETPQNKESIKNQMLQFQIIAAFVLFALIFLLAPLIAAGFNDSSLTFYIQITSLLILFRPVFTIMDGFSNGTKQFMKQGHLTIFLMFSKTLLILLLAFLYGLIGAFIGFAIAILFSSIFAFFLVGIKRNPGISPITRSKLLFFLIPVALFSLIANLLQTLDLLLVKALTPAASSSLLAGYYSAASTISKIPWTLVLGISFAVFPFVSSTSFRKDYEKTRNYISIALRYSVLFLVPAVILIYTTSAEIIEFLFSDAYLPGAEALSILIIGMGGYALLTVIISIMQSLNRAGLVVTVGIALIILNAYLNLLLIPYYSIEGAALATTISVFVGLFFFLFWIQTKYQAGLPSKSFLRIAAAGLIIYLLSPFFPVTGFWLIFSYLALMAVYLGILLLLKEIKISEFRNMLQAAY